MVEIESAIVAFGGQGTEQAKLRAYSFGLGVLAGKKEDDWMFHHRRLNRIQQCVGTKKRENMADPGNEGQSDFFIFHLAHQTWNESAGGICVIFESVV